MTSIWAVGSASGNYAVSELQDVVAPKALSAELPGMAIAVASAAEVCGQSPKLLIIAVVTPSGEPVGKFAVEPVSKIAELKAYLAILLNVDPWHQTLFHGGDILADDIRWIDTFVKDADGVLLVIQPRNALDNTTIQKAAQDFCRGGKPREDVERAYGHVSRWETAQVTEMSGLFQHNYEFNEHLSKWDVSNVTDMTFMFNQATAFNGDLSVWNVRNVTNMYGMFQGAQFFNGDLSEWNVAGVTDMSYMFYKAKSFNSDLSAWSVSPGTLTIGTFNGAAISPDRKPKELEDT